MVSRLGDLTRMLIVVKNNVIIGLRAGELLCVHVSAPSVEKGDRHLARNESWWVLGGESGSSAVRQPASPAMSSVVMREAFLPSFILSQDMTSGV